MGCHAFLQGTFQPKDQTWVSWVFCITGGLFTTEAPGKPSIMVLVALKNESGYVLSSFLSYSEFNHPALMHISILTSISLISGLPRWLVIKNPPANSGDIGDTGLIPGMGRSPGGMATHSSVIAWRIPWTAEPGGLQSMGSQRDRRD